MTMKKFFSIIVLSALVLLLTGCDKIDVDHIHKPYTPISGGKTVLIKDFTGVRCVYCPGAAEYAHELQHRLGEDRVLILAVHAGAQAQPIGKFPDFLTEEGALWYNNNESNPLFAVDRVSLTEGHTLGASQIDAPVAEALTEPQLFDIEINGAYDETTRHLKVENHFHAAGDGQGTYYATVCLVEDSIVGRQMFPVSVFPNGVDTAYVFRNVFRGTLNGADGELVTNGSFFVEDVFVQACSMVLDSTFNANQCYILTYLYDHQDGKIVQSAMQKIK